jgi:formate hydrogenlyase transcriptional activator
MQETKLVVFDRVPGWTGRNKSMMVSQPQADGWLGENGPQELERLFRAIIINPSASILLVNDDRHYLEASVGASKLLGLPREKIIGLSLDDFAEPSSKPMISERWRAFLKEGEQEGTLRLVGPDGGPQDVEYSAKGNVLPVRHLLMMHDKNTPGGGPVTTDKQPSKSNVPAWVRDYALFLLDAEGQVAAWYGGGNVFTLQER